MSPPGEPPSKACAPVAISVAKPATASKFVFETCIFNICLITPSESSNQGCQIINVEAVRFVPSRALKLCLFFGGVWRPCGRVRVLARQRRSWPIKVLARRNRRPGPAWGRPVCPAAKFVRSNFAHHYSLPWRGPPVLRARRRGQEQGRSTAGPGPQRASAARLALQAKPRHSQAFPHHHLDHSPD